jgi:hypothetical protein
MVVPSRPPYYELEDIVNACSNSTKVFATGKAKKAAKEHFGLQTETAILQFVHNNVFEELEHQNTDKLDKGPDAGTFFDAYIFRIGPKYVYFAFYKRPDVWIIKSFHPPDFGDKASPLSSKPFKELLEGLQK